MLVLVLVLVLVPVLVLVLVLLQSRRRVGQPPGALGVTPARRARGPPP